MKPVHLVVRVLAGLVCIALLAGFSAPDTVTIAAGPFIKGSSKAEREAAYRLDEKAYGHSVTRRQGWYDREYKRHTLKLPAYAITTTPVTNGQYGAFIAATGHRVPWASRKEWKSYRLIHPYRRAQKYMWKGPAVPKGRSKHPVVMVAYEDAVAYARWLSEKTGKTWRLPTENEWEKAVRGTRGWMFPWGNTFDPKRLNSHDAGPFTTTPVDAYANGKGEFGLLDGAGQVFEWTSVAAGKGRHIVKGGSWDDKGCGVCRPAARHSRPDVLKHILVGFRLVLEIKD